MRLFRALALVSAIACSDGVGPSRTVSLDGTYLLTTIDDHALPYAVTIDGEAVTVTSGQLELSAPANIAVSLLITDPGSATSRVVALSGRYRRVSADSLVFPNAPAPEIFLRRTGSTVVLLTQPSSLDFGLADALGGAHRFTFVAEP
jgi:hypothetical protein